MQSIDGPSPYWDFSEGVSCAEGSWSGSSIVALSLEGQTVCINHVVVGRILRPTSCLLLSPLMRRDPFLRTSRVYPQLLTLFPHLRGFMGFESQLLTRPPPRGMPQFQTQICTQFSEYWPTGFSESSFLTATFFLPPRSSVYPFDSLLSLIAISKAIKTKVLSDLNASCPVPTLAGPKQALLSVPPPTNWLANEAPLHPKKTWVKQPHGTLLAREDGSEVLNSRVDGR